MPVVPPGANAERRGHDARPLVREKKTTAHPHVEMLLGDGGAPATPRTDPVVARLAWGAVPVRCPTASAFAFSERARHAGGAERRDL